MDSLPPGPILAASALLIAGAGILVGYVLGKRGAAARRAQALQPREELPQQQDEQSSSRPPLLSGIHALDNITVNRSNTNNPASKRPGRIAQRRALRECAANKGSAWITLAAVPGWMDWLMCNS